MAEDTIVLDTKKVSPPGMLSHGSGSTKSGSSSSGSSLGGPRFIPGRNGVTKGYLLPLARELQFNFEEPPDDARTAECDRYHALMLLACWEEIVEAEQQAAYWASLRESEKTERQKTRTAAASKLKGAARAQLLARRLQAGMPPSEASAAIMPTPANPSSIKGAACAQLLARRLHARTPARAAPDGVGTTSAAANRSSMSAANVLGLS